MESPTYEACRRKGSPCVGWVDEYFKDCVCSFRDDVSFALGMISLVFWAVAEIPQLVSNFRNKSGHGVSLGLLFTWVIGDIFNLVGCTLEPATLPTQLYTALLYTVITVILVLQTLYYDFFIKWIKSGGFQKHQEIHTDEHNRTNNDHDVNKKDWRRGSTDQTAMPIPTTPLISSFIRRDMFYTSARSLAGRWTRPSHLRVSSTVPAVAATVLVHSSSDEEEEDRRSRRRSHCPPPPRTSMSRSAGYGTFLAGFMSLPTGTNAFMEGQMVLLGRRLLQETEPKSNPFGVWLGWIMAAIYMGGRLPQIYLNMKRGSVEGLNPLMFLFSLIANSTYVGSILVRSVEWTRIKSNAPWLLDAVVCVLLDLFIIMQYANYKYMRGGKASHEEEYEGFAEAEKPLLV